MAGGAPVFVVGRPDPPDGLEGWFAFPISPVELPFPAVIVGEPGVLV
jgi:hypothetical protein